MGWKGSVRSISAAYRAADRESKKRHRELQRNEKAYAKMQVLEQAAYDVEAYENYLERFLSIHKEFIQSINWLQLKASPEPVKPIPITANEDAAKKIEAEYRPSFFERFFGFEEKKRVHLATNVKEAAKKDFDFNINAELEWKNLHEEWIAVVELAAGVLNKDPLARLSVIEQMDPLSELTELGSSLDFRINEREILECDLVAHGNEVIPHEVKTLLSNGKLSVKKMPITQFNELYQDYVCGCVLRVSNEIFGLLPEETLIITVIDTLLNTSTGHLEKQPILSALIHRKTISALNMETIDPSDSMRNFIHNMAFNKKTGFSAVERVSSSKS
jgi:hypothetical protein